MIVHHVVEDVTNTPVKTVYFYFMLLALASLSEGFERKQQNHLLCGWYQKNVIQNNHHSFYNEGVQAIKIRKNGDYNG